MTKQVKKQPKTESVPRVGIDPFTLGVALGALDETAAAALEERRAAGLGSWRFYYKLGWKPTTDRERAGLLAMKQAFIEQGYGKGIDLAMEVFGNAVTNRTKEFQAAFGLVADGIIGPNTARRLFRFYYAAAEARYAIPDRRLARIGYGESNDDPIAEGVVDDDDEGILQEHLPFHPDLTLAQAWTPSYVIAYGGKQLADLRAGTGSWKGAVAGWNVGRTYAKLWVQAGYPSEGGPSMGTDPVTGKTIDAFTRATNYEAYVMGLPF